MTQKLECAAIQKERARWGIQIDNPAPTVQVTVKLPYNLMSGPAVDASLYVAWDTTEVPQFMKREMLIGARERRALQPVLGAQGLACLQLGPRE